MTILKWYQYYNMRGKIYRLNKKRILPVVVSITAFLLFFFSSFAQSAEIKDKKTSRIPKDENIKAKEPDLKALGVPKFPGMVFIWGTEPSKDDQEETQGEPGENAREGRPSYYLYSVDQPFEKVVAYYEKQLGKESHKGRPKDLKAKYPNSKIPKEVKGKQATFTIIPKGVPKPTVYNPLTGITGGVNIIISDYFFEPEGRNFESKTSIMIFHYPPAPLRETPDAIKDFVIPEQTPIPGLPPPDDSR